MGVLRAQDYRNRHLNEKCLNLSAHMHACMQKYMCISNRACAIYVHVPCKVPVPEHKWRGKKNTNLLQITVLEPDFKCIRLSILIYGNLQMRAAETVQVIQNGTCIY